MAERSTFGYKSDICLDHILHHRLWMFLNQFQGGDCRSLWVTVDNSDSFVEISGRRHICSYVLYRFDCTTCNITTVSLRNGLDSAPTDSNSPSPSPSPSVEAPYLNCRGDDSFRLLIICNICEISIVSQSTCMWLGRILHHRVSYAISKWEMGDFFEWYKRIQFSSIDI